jgi:hypothetical protein
MAVSQKDWGRKMFSFSSFRRHFSAILGGFFRFD